MRADVLEVLDGGKPLSPILLRRKLFRHSGKNRSNALTALYYSGIKGQRAISNRIFPRTGFCRRSTAGLHFTLEMMDKLRKKGVHIGYVTLHVGLGTFRPVKVDEITEHKMHSEHYRLPEETAQLINQTKEAGGRVIAVGTTSTRTLESVAAKYGEIRADEGYTDIFIYPGRPIRVRMD